MMKFSDRFFTVVELKPERKEFFMETLNILISTLLILALCFVLMLTVTITNVRIEYQKAIISQQNPSLFLMQLHEEFSRIEAKMVALTFLLAGISILLLGGNY